MNERILHNNKINIEIRKQIFMHTVWLKSGGQQGKRANLHGVDLRGADFSGADLSGAYLRGADFSGADLSGADLDFCQWPLWCGSLKAKIDKKIAVQLLYHTMRAMQSVDDEEIKKFLSNKDNIKLANQFHREECERLVVEEGDEG